MGLDQSVYWIDEEDFVGDIENPREDYFYTDIYYWRKFYSLNNWMGDLWEKKGGKREDFNCSYMRLYPEDIDQLEKDMEKDDFWIYEWEYEEREEHKADLKKFIDMIRTEYSDCIIVYHPWW